MKPRWMTLKWFFLLLAALLPVGLISLFTLAIAYKSVRDLVRTNNQAAITTMAEMLARDFGVYMNVLRSFASIPELANAIERHDPEAVRNQLRLATETFPKAVHLYVADNEGQMWSQFSEEGGLPASSREKREWLNLLNRKGQPVVSSVYERGGTTSGVVALAVPVRGQNQKQVGILVCEYPMDEITARLRQLSPGGTGIAFILDPAGTVAAHPRLFSPGASRDEFAGLSTVVEALRGKAQTAEYFDPVTQAQMVGTFQPVMVRDRRWVVAAAQPVHEAYATLQQAKMQIGFAAGVLAMGAMALVTVLGRSSERNRHLNQILSEHNRQLKHFEAIVEFSNDAIISTDLSGQIENWNPAAQRICGYAPGEMEGKSIFLLASVEQRAALEQFFGKVKHGGSLVNYETVLLHKADRQIHASLTVSSIKNEEGTTTGLSFMVRDITERKQAEEDLVRERYLVETLMDAIPDHIYFKNRESRFLRINRSMAVRFNLKDPAEAVGKTDFDFFAREHADQAYRDEQEMLKTGRSLVNREEKEIWPDGSVSWVSTTKICLRDQTKTIIGTFGLSRDITARKQAEEALNEKAKELARSNKDLEEFAYVASHDLQEPLRMIASYTQLLERRYKDKLDQDAREFIAYAVDGASRMQVLINDLLAYSRVGTRGKPFAMIPCEEVLARTLSNLKILVEETGAQITHAALPCVLGDPTQLTQLFQNLVNNAIKFRRKEQPPQIHISAELEHGTEEGATPSWHFAVADNGIGIDRKFFDRIFLIFQRLHTRDQYPGTGIGLSVCKKIVERHGGRIWVESESGQGTKFHFTLPCIGPEKTLPHRVD